MPGSVWGDLLEMTPAWEALSAMITRSTLTSGHDGSSGVGTSLDLAMRTSLFGSLVSSRTRGSDASLPTCASHGDEIAHEEVVRAHSVRDSICAGEVMDGGERMKRGFTRSLATATTSASFLARSNPGSLTRTTENLTWDLGFDLQLRCWDLSASPNDSGQQKKQTEERPRVQTSVSSWAAGPGIIRAALSASRRAFAPNLSPTWMSDTASWTARSSDMRAVASASPAKAHSWAFSGGSSWDSLPLLSPAPFFLRSAARLGIPSPLQRPPPSPEPSPPLLMRSQSGRPRASSGRETRFPLRPLLSPLWNPPDSGGSFGKGGKEQVRRVAGRGSSRLHLLDRGGGGWRYVMRGGWALTIITLACVLPASLETNHCSVASDPHLHSHPHHNPSSTSGWNLPQPRNAKKGARARDSEGDWRTPSVGYMTSPQEGISLKIFLPSNHCISTLFAATKTHKTPYTESPKLREGEKSWRRGSEHRVYNDGLRFCPAAAPASEDETLRSPPDAAPRKRNSQSSSGKEKTPSSPAPRAQKAASPSSRSPTTLRACSERRADFTFRFLCPPWRQKMIAEDFDAREAWLTAYKSLVPPEQHACGRGYKKHNGPTFPLVGGAELDPLRLLHAVAERGGAAKVTKQRKWKEVTRPSPPPKAVGACNGDSALSRCRWGRSLG